jgi:hypothetical protein
VIGSLNGITLNQHVDPFSHLQFVDNNLLMGETTYRESNSFKGILDKFFLSSRAQVNQGKYFIYFFNTPLNIQCSISKSWVFNKEIYPQNIWGLLSFPMISKNSSCEELLTKTNCKARIFVSSHFLEKSSLPNMYYNSCLFIFFHAYNSFQNHEATSEPIEILSMGWPK